MNKNAADSTTCPLCLTNKIFEGTVLATSPAAFLTRSTFSPKNYLIIPKAHVENTLELPDTWWKDMKLLISQIPDLTEHYNISVNYGKNAGQSILHLHFWVIPRAQGEPSSGKGLARLISECNQSIS